MAFWERFSIDLRFIRWPQRPQNLLCCMVQGKKNLRLHLRNPVLEAPCSISGGFYWKRLSVGRPWIWKCWDFPSLQEWWHRLPKNPSEISLLLAQWFSILREVLIKSLLLILSVTGWLPKHSKNKSKCLKHVETANPSLPWNFRTSPAFPKKENLFISLPRFLTMECWPAPNRFPSAPGPPVRENQLQIEDAKRLATSNWRRVVQTTGLKGFLKKKQRFTMNDPTLRKGRCRMVSEPGSPSGHQVAAADKATRPFFPPRA